MCRVNQRHSPAQFSAVVDNHVQTQKASKSIQRPQGRGSYKGCLRKSAHLKLAALRLRRRCSIMTARRSPAKAKPPIRISLGRLSIHVFRVLSLVV